MSFDLNGDLPNTTGFNYTSTLHTHAEGPTLPANNRVSSDSFAVLVTGAGKGLGKGVALAYAQAGASQIIIASRTGSDLEALSKELKDINPKVDILAQPCDTTKEEDVAALAKATKERFGGLDVCVANAGVISKYLDDGSLPGSLVDDLDFDRVVSTNVLGVVRTARHFLPLLISKEIGAKAFVAMTSLAAHGTDSKLTPVAYNVSKLSLCRIAESIVNDHKSTGIRAFAVHPGGVVTPQTEKHSLEKGDAWEKALGDDVGLCGGFLTWLTREPRDWLNGRYLSATWDVEELEGKKDDIVQRDLLKFRMGL